ncbi:hypothetical protein GCM10018785_37670 [Streptomyces longispororuber]|uniref:Uncharacterized protein n=1 Tax=Streptomyces longispororuber TaxID=68230 RepID=A0A918ZQA9_9ACTN|nr:hypothetical protein GCM10018785_37670 [Streptomyces longispororuber]
MRLGGLVTTYERQPPTGVCGAVLGSGRDPVPPGAFRPCPLRDVVTMEHGRTIRVAHGKDGTLK